MEKDPERAAPAAATDGRTERGRQTREKIADALLALLDEGATEFPAEKVAAYAGVSRRSVFHHFADMAQLVDTAITRRLEQLAEQIRPLPTTGPRSVRVAALAEQRARILEWITPARKAVMRMDHPSPRIQQTIDEAFADARTRLEAVLAQELDALTGQRRSDLVDGLDAVTTWGAWHHWRSTGLTPDQARHAMEATVLNLLASIDRQPQPQPQPRPQPQPQRQAGAGPGPESTPDSGPDPGPPA
ncbi:TetR/AcrR family transcriptional regulator [Streptomyces sp. NPDC059851]|uniref:TetR/AcrR family transcriptional regulator n=1 Tax=Streptomyces sp. NPDC059851 TaxID=3346971 RepID=UPI00365CD99A